jgi:ferric-dicitrate binding protein FerR (iron transport regulator)
LKKKYIPQQRKNSLPTYLLQRRVLKNMDLQQAFVRYLADEASPEEIKFLIQQLGRKKGKEKLKAIIRQHLESNNDPPEQKRREWELILKDNSYKAIAAHIEEKKSKEDHIIIQYQTPPKTWLKLSVAAVIALLIASSIFILFTNKQERPLPPPVQSLSAHDIAPGGNKAILTLANGTKITLDTTKMGIISIQGGTKIIKQNNGLLTYSKSQAGQSQTLFNTISTPKGGQYQIVLSDGTKVWLNAASSIRFPNEFSGETREVAVTGEAYFEVTSDPIMPFNVLVNGMIIKVLGTHFNVRAYKDEPTTKITLMEGAIKVIEGNKSALLKPHQQLQINPAGRLITIDDVNMQGILAWKNNQFWFHDDSIQTVMRELSRWYNMNVIIEGQIPQHFGGYISKDLYVSQVFEALQATSHIQYKIQDSTIIVSP